MKMKAFVPLRRVSARSRSGFTLIEVGLALLIMSMLFLGATDLFLTAARNTASTNARTQTTLDASNGIQYVLMNGREATSYAVPTDAGWVSPRGTAASYQSGAIYAGIEFNYDNRVTTQPILCVTDCVAGTASVPVYDSTQPTTGQTIWVYRADVDGTPDAAAGMYLHATIRPAGAVGSGSDTNYTISRTIETTRTDASQFHQAGHQRLPGRGRQRRLRRADLGRGHRRVRQRP